MADGISRRTMLKRAGAGAAVAWSAPAVFSVASRASAGTPGVNPQCHGNCAELCINQNQCGTGGLFDYCGCTTNTEGDCFCWSNVFCSDVPDCSTSADCA